MGTVRLVAPFTALLVALLGAVFGPTVGGVATSDIGTYAAVALGGLLTALHAKKIPTAAKHTIHKVRRRPRPPPSTWFGIDWAWGQIAPRTLHTIGASFACRYLSTDLSKNLTPAESRRLAHAGIKRVVVWETSAMRTLDGFQAGVDDAHAALAQARACGLPADGDWAIYFAIDFDASGPDIAAYFQGAHSVLGGHTGAYGGLRPLAYLLDRRLIGYAWQTYAWSAGRWEPRAHLIQFSNGHVVAGVQVDFDRALKPGYGGW